MLCDFDDRAAACKKYKMLNRRHLTAVAIFAVA
jgi:hypothetical protein